MNSQNVKSFLVLIDKNKISTKEGYEYFRKIHNVKMYDIIHLTDCILMIETTLEIMTKLQKENNWIIKYEEPAIFELS
jgi:orotate phosphoribosyltransferase